MLPPITTFQHRFGPLRYFMAPMAGITDVVFRTLIRQMGAEVVISELLSAEGLVRGGQKTRDLMRFSEQERPIGIQLFGSDKKTLTEAAHIVESEGADFVDINFGCPVRKVVCDGAGAAWLKEPEKMGDLLGAIKAALRIPLTIKVRTGWDEESRNVEEVVRVAGAVGVSWVAIHGRTRAQGYAGQSDWDLIRHVARSSSIPVIGNGDILTSQDALLRIANGDAHAVMIGRGALKNPWIFRQIIEKSFEGVEGERNLLAVIDKHFDLAIEFKGQTRAYLSLKKFMGWYAAGFPYSSSFRSRIFQTHDIHELRQIATDYFSSVNVTDRVADTQPFLMGGHG
jgi:tRNA-dihydrouridine synthase B